VCRVAEKSELEGVETLLNTSVRNSIKPVAEKSELEGVETRQRILTRQL